MCMSVYECVREGGDTSPPAHAKIRDQRFPVPSRLTNSVTRDPTLISLSF